MSKRNQDKGRLSPFVPYLKDTMREPAWKAMSLGARMLYLHLKANYNAQSHNNGRVYLSTRVARKELGSGLSQIGRWFRELQHYGFIVMMHGGCLGVDGKGRAPKWRLTELGYMKESPTRDYARWDGVLFDDSQKQNPDPESGIRVIQKAGSVVIQKAGSLPQPSDPENWIKGKAPGDPESGIKYIITTWVAGAGSGERDAEQPSHGIGHNLGPPLNGSADKPDGAAAAIKASSRRQPGVTCGPEPSAGTLPCLEPVTNCCGVVLNWSHE
jgi:hypothetical protein